MLGELVTLRCDCGPHLAPAREEKLIISDVPVEDPAGSKRVFVTHYSPPKEVL
jgi:hypothetical protein